MPSRFLEQPSKWGKMLGKSTKQRHGPIRIPDQWRRGQQVS
jgi:hypothetical protein